MAHKAFHQREIGHLQEQNSRIVSEVENCEADRDRAHEQLKACEERDASLQSEVQGQRDKIGSLNSRLQQDSSERVAKDEHVKVLGEQNNQMLALLEAEENKARDHASRIKDLESKNRKLQMIADQFDVAKAELETQVADVKEKGSSIFADLRHVRSANENLRANIQNTEAKTRVEIEALGQALQVVENKNLEYMSRINKQETREKQLEAETNTMKEEVEGVRSQIDELRKQLEGDEEGRNEFERRRGQTENAIESLEIQADTLKKALSTAERANEQVQEENKTAADRCRETADKVYALMDSLRLNQVELKKQEAENIMRDKKLINLERQTQNLQAKLSMECDAKVLAEQERKEAEQEAVVLKKKNKVVEESVTKAQMAQEQAERDIAEINEKVAAHQTQNAYLASRIDTQEEEKNTVKAEIKKMTDKSAELVVENTALRDESERLEEDVATARHDLESYRQELAHIKREDVLDDTGRQRPVLIQSNESDLLEKLQINEFLYEAQQARNPVPPMVEKVAQLLAMLHESQGRADTYLGDLSKCNGLVSALRQRNMALYSRTQMFESFKTRALLRYVMNLFEGDLCTNMHLDGIGFGLREINEMLMLVPKYNAAEKIFVVSLIDNGLDDDCINIILQLVHTLPYLRSLDLKRNCFTHEGLKKLESQLKIIEGVTGVIRTAEGVLKVHSGNQLRFAVDVSEQIPKEHVAKEADFSTQEELSHKDADPFLSTNSGSSGHPWAAKGGKLGGAAVGGGRAAPQHAAADLGPQASPVARGDGAGAATPSLEQHQPTIGGPPVGLGGPGNVAALNKRGSAGAGKAAAKKLPEKRQAGRAKAGPPPVLDGGDIVWQRELTRQLSGGYGGSQAGCGYSGSQPQLRDSSAYAAVGGRGVDRTKSMPALSAQGTHGRGLPPVPMAPKQQQQRPPRGSATGGGVRRASLGRRP